MTRKNTGERVELFEGGWLILAEALPPVRVIVTRYLASSPACPVKVGKRVGEWIYELFLTSLAVESFLVQDVVDLYHGRGAFETIFAEEDLEDDPDRWCSYTECGQELWQIAWKSGMEYSVVAGTRHAGKGAARDGVVSPARTSPTVVLI